jgi:DGQHR domain-containing protein
LDKNRAQQIADYVDSGFGTIPNSIVLSAQPAAHLRVTGRGKTLEFVDTNQAFLVLDGQHRVYGFSLAKTALRVPVVIYNGLSRQDETRLFIDINTKQRPVPNELLLDIKGLAGDETDDQKLKGAVFDLFANRQDSPLLGLMSPASRAAGKISRVTFYGSLQPLIRIFEHADAAAIYEALNSFLRAFVEGLQARKIVVPITNPTLFKAVMMIFPDAARRIKDRFGPDYSQSNFAEVLAPLLQKIRPSIIKSPGNSQRTLYEAMLKALQTDFTL